MHKPLIALLPIVQFNSTLPLKCSLNEDQLKESCKASSSTLSDIRRAAPEKWKTIIRQPIG